MNKLFTLVFTALVAMSGPAMAIGAGVVDITTTRDVFTLRKDGTNESEANATAGVSNANAALRVIAPVAAIKFKYDSRNNRYESAGKIKANARARGGAANANAGLEVVQ